MQTNRKGEEKTFTGTGIYNISDFHNILKDNNIFIGKLNINYLNTFMPHQYNSKPELIKYPEWREFFDALDVRSLNLLNTSVEDKILDTIYIAQDLLKNTQIRPVMCHWFGDNIYHVHPGRARVKAMRFIGYSSVMSVIQTPKHINLNMNKIIGVENLLEFGTNIFFRDTLYGLIENSYRRLLEPVWFDSTGIILGNYDYDPYRKIVKEKIKIFLKNNELSNESFKDYLLTQSFD